PYALNMDRIWELCARTGTWLELNASPDRLDINAEQVKTAREYGIPIAINTDAHQVSGLADMRYGVLTARRGWAEAKDVVNTWPLGKLKQELNHKKG
ncbi:MAG: DNA polymerase/3'-5' exonuclease PolX, partial [Clostridia bacterium]|nr:DNA polymerase/3'-5' exonuclease PolX [Clostridia bacterium]